MSANTPEELVRIRRSDGSTQTLTVEELDLLNQKKKERDQMIGQPRTRNAFAYLIGAGIVACLILAIELV